MRAVAALLLLGHAAPAQFKSTVPLVVAPTTIKDRKGHLIDGLTGADLVLYDNNVPQAIHLDTVVNPISLVVAVQASSNSAAVLDKLGRSGILFSQLLAGDRGETAVVSFSDSVQVFQDFTTDPDLLSRALQNLRVQGDGAATLEGVMQALRMLSHRKAGALLADLFAVPHALHKPAENRGRPGKSGRQGKRSEEGRATFAPRHGPR